MIRALRTHHLGSSVADLRVASELVEALGFEEVARSNLGGDDMARGNALPRASAGMVLLRRDSLLIELLEFGEGTSGGSECSRRAGETPGAE